MQDLTGSFIEEKPHGLQGSIRRSRRRVDVRIDYDPEGIAENLASAFGVIASQINGDLDRFKHFIGSRGVETGAWRGEIHGQEVKKR